MYSSTNEDGLLFSSILKGCSACVCVCVCGCGCFPLNWPRVPLQRHWSCHKLYIEGAVNDLRWSEPVVLDEKSAFRGPAAPGSSSKAAQFQFACRWRTCKRRRPPPLRPKHLQELSGPLCSPPCFSFSATTSPYYFRFSFLLHYFVIPPGDARNENNRGGEKRRWPFMPHFLQTGKKIIIFYFL